MMNELEVREFYRSLGHAPYGATELVAIDRMGRGITATGRFSSEDAFVRSCRRLGGRNNLYAGRNPRVMPRSSLDKLDTRKKVRAKDSEIQYVTALSLDIESVRPRGIPATNKQRKDAASFALNMQWDLGGWVYDSGNGVYLWFAFKTPIKVIDHRLVREKCRIWQEVTVRRYEPEKYGLRVDGCFDLSRIKRVIGTLNHKGGRLSRTLAVGERSDMVRNQILAVEVPEPVRRSKAEDAMNVTAGELPFRFKRLLKWDLGTRLLWEKPDKNGDRSNHDWTLGLRCVEAGITVPRELAAILMSNPNGKYRRDGRRGYVDVTVGKLLNAKLVDGSLRS